MADRYWVGGSGTWSSTLTTNWSNTSGGAGGFSAPTSADNVIFDVNSNVGTTIFTVTLGTSPSCLNFSFGSGAQALDAVMTLDGSGVLSIYGSLTLVSTNLTVTALGAWFFRSTSTGNTIDTAGKTIGVGGITFNGVGGGWTLQSNLICGNANNGIDIVAGNLDTNGFSVTTGAIQSIGTSTRSLTARSSTFTFSSSFSAVNFGGSNFTFNCGTSTITSTNAAQSLGFNGGGYTFYNVNFNGNTVTVTVAIRGANTFNNLTFATVSASGIRTYTFDANQTINGTLTANGQVGVRRVLFSSSIIGTQITLSINTFNSTLGCIDFRDIAVTGTAAPLSVGSMGDLGGNSGISFTVKTVYWNLAGTQSWNANGWSSTSGGVTNSSNFPLAQDTAVINNAGAATTINTVANYAYPNIDFSTRTTAVTFNQGAINLYGSMTLSSAVTFTQSGVLTYSGRVSSTLDTASKTLAQGVAVNCLTGSLTLGSDLTVNGSTPSLTLTSGTFDASTYNVSITQTASGNNFVSNGTVTRTLSMGSGLWTLTKAGSNLFFWNVASTGLTFNKGTANITLINTSNIGTPVFATAGLTYNKITVAPSLVGTSLQVTGSGAYGELSCTSTYAFSIQFDNSSTQTCAAFTMSGSPGNVPTISGATTFVKTGGGVVSVNYLNTGNTNASPALTWYAGTNSINGGGTGWIFTAPPSGGTVVNNGLFFGSNF